MSHLDSLTVSGNKGGSTINQKLELGVLKSTGGDESGITLSSDAEVYIGNVGTAEQAFGTIVNKGGTLFAGEEGENSHHYLFKVEQTGGTSTFYGTLHSTGSGFAMFSASNDGKIIADNLIMEVGSSLSGDIEIKDTLTAQATLNISTPSTITIGKEVVVNADATITLFNSSDDSDAGILTAAKVTLNGDNSKIKASGNTKLDLGTVFINGNSAIYSAYSKNAKNTDAAIEIDSLQVAGGASVTFVDDNIKNDEGVLTLYDSSISIGDVTLGEGALFSNTGAERSGYAAGGFKDLQVAGTMTAEGAVIENGTDAGLTIGTLAGSANTIIVDDLTSSQVVIGTNASTGLTLKTSDESFAGSMDANDIAAGLTSLAKTVKITNLEDSNGYQVAVDESSVLGALTGDFSPDGTLQSYSEAENTVSRSVIDIAASDYLAFRSQINDVSARLGDLRTMPKSAGAWARVYGGQMKYSGGMKNDYRTVQAGADGWFNPSIYLGAVFSYTDSEGTLHNGSADIDNFNFGLYGGWVSENGFYVDLTLKRHRAESDFDLYYTSGALAEASFSRWGTSGSIEAGWRFNCPNTGFYAEPQAELMLGHLDDASFTTSQGVSVREDSISTVIGRAGIAVGYVLPESKGSIYFKASALHDWDGELSADFTADGVSRRLEEDLGGTWGEFALGGTYNPTERLSAYGQVKTSAGSPVRNPWQVSLGVRWAF